MLYLISSFICIAYYLYVGFKCQSTMFSYQIMKNNTGFIIKQRSFCWLLSGKAHGLSAQYVTEMIIILHLSLSLFKQNFATIHLTLAFPGKGKGSVVLLVFTKVLLIFLFTPIYRITPSILLIPIFLFLHLSFAIKYIHSYLLLHLLTIISLFFFSTKKNLYPSFELED